MRDESRVTEIFWGDSSGKQKSVGGEEKARKKSPEWALNSTAQKKVDKITGGLP